MKVQLVSLLVIALGFIGCGNNETAQPETQSTPQTANSSGDYLSTITKAQQSTVGKLDIVAVEGAIQRFQVDQGRNPNDLNELVAKKYLAQLPTPPFGKSYSYDAKTGSVKLVP